MSQVTQNFISEEQGEGSGNSVRLIINALVDAALTKNAGPEPPPDPRPKMEWHNTQSNTLMERDAENVAWLVKQSFDRAAPPTLAENELNNYPPGSEWFTSDARAWKHLGGGNWAEIGEGQAASLFAPTLGVLGGRRFAAESDETINAVVIGGPRFALGASAPVPAPNSHLFGLIPSIRFPIYAVTIGYDAADPQILSQSLFEYLQFSTTTTGYAYFDFPIMTAPTHLNLKISHFLASGSAGTYTWGVSTALITNFSSLSYGTETTLTASSAAMNVWEMSHLLMHSAGAVIGNVIRARLRRTGGTAGPLAISDIWIEQNP